MAASPDDRTRDRTSDRPSGRRGPAWLPLAAAAVVVPTVLAGVTLLWPRPGIEDRLTTAAQESLQTAGLGAAGVDLSGRDATLTGLTGAEGERAVAVVEEVPGVRVAQLADGTDDPADGTGADAQAAPFGISRDGEDVVLTGTVGSEEERAQLVAAATAQAGGRAVVDRLTVTPGATLPPGVDAASVGAATGVLAGATGEGLSATVGDGAVTLSGTVPDEAASGALAGALGGALPGTGVDNRLAVDPGAGGGGADLDSAARAQLQAQLDALTGAAPITFAPDSPALTAEGEATLERVIEAVRAVPAARLQVDGFVAAGPGEGPLTAQQLSEQRAATVRDAFVAAGVPADRVTAQGLAEGSTPVADAAGRRVEITVV